jgi:2-polyprenyl-6-methoxyphenol hydroxylase-like FAD-dependent oxidoreductase
MEKQQKEETSKIVWENEGVDVRGEKYMTSRHGAPMNVKVEQKSPLVKDESEEFSIQKLQKEIAKKTEVPPKILYFNENGRVPDEQVSKLGERGQVLRVLQREGEKLDKSLLQNWIKTFSVDARQNHDKNYPLDENDTVVIVGGGYAGAVAALNLKKQNPALNIKLIERRNTTHCAGGPASCKGCMGLINGTALDKLAELGIEVPEELVLANIDQVEFRNFNNLDGNIDSPMPRVENRREVLIADGNGPAGLFKNQSLSFPQFLRDAAIERGIDMVSGTASNIYIPENAAQKSVVLCDTEQGGEIFPADFVINATGINDSHRLGISTYSKNENGFTEKPILEKGEFHYSGLFEIVLSEEEIQKSGLNPKSFYAWYGMSGTEAVLAMLKKHDDKNWLSVIVAPTPADFPQEKNEQETRKGIKQIFDNFWDKAGFSEKIGKKSPQCRCIPKVPTVVSESFSHHRYVTLGDSSGAMKYKKNGIGYLIENAKNIAEGAVKTGVTNKALKEHNGSNFNYIKYDNMLGQAIFKATLMANTFKPLGKLYEMLLKKSNAVRQFGVRFVANIESAYPDSTAENVKDLTSYTDTTIQTVKDLLTPGKTPAETKKKEARLYKFIEDHNELIQRESSFIWKLNDMPEAKNDDIYGEEKKDGRQEFS